MRDEYNLMYWNWELTYWENLNNSVQTMMFLCLFLCIVLMISYAIDRFRKTEKTEDEKQGIENLRALAIIMMIFIMTISMISYPFIRKNLNAEPIPSIEEIKNK